MHNYLKNTSNKNEVTLLVPQGRNTYFTIPHMKKYFLRYIQLNSKLENIEIRYKTEHGWEVLGMQNPRHFQKEDIIDTLRIINLGNTDEIFYERFTLEYELFEEDQYPNAPTRYMIVHAYEFNLELNLDNKCFDWSNRKYPELTQKIGKYHWSWGPKTFPEQTLNISSEALHPEEKIEQKGAIIMADIDDDDFIEPDKRQSELVRVETHFAINPSFENTDDEYFLALSTDQLTAYNFGLYEQMPNNELKLMLGAQRKNPESLENVYTFKFKSVGLVANEVRKYFLRANYLPNAFFNGIITFSYQLYKTLPDPSEPPLLIYQDHVVLRVAPWIMLPNTQIAKKVFVKKINAWPDDIIRSEEFNRQLKSILGKEMVEEIESDKQNRDRWVQDEFEIGYCESPAKTIPVVCDSPRNRGLNKWVKDRFLKPDFGHLEITISKKTSLDYFGNLESSPPVEGYPFGRIIIGGSPKQGFEHTPRQIAHELKEFLHAQQIQAPIELYIDWLSVGHVDEILSFVPWSNQKGFRMIFASPQKGCELFKQALKEKKYDKFHDPLNLTGKYKKAGPEIEAILHKHEAYNTQIQAYQDWNRNLLKEELKLEEEDIIDMPVLFRGTIGKRRAKSLFPDLTNLLVVRKSPRLTHVIAPKPFGPVTTEGIYLFEQHFWKLLGEEPQLKIHFINDAQLYFKRAGDVHCATNVFREPFDKKWWEYKPPQGHNI
ncbi:MAG TPA: hypothetical protein DCS93_24640 [Microscillaceae bacterium]|nr:hypothetical protein [Microscillaceae bacterium]